MRVLRLMLMCCLMALPGAALAQCMNPDPTGENDCDMDGCRVRNGDCVDTDVTIRGPGCPGRGGGMPLPAGAAPEICDNKDNNCNTIVDEGPSGTPGTVDAGMACFVPGQQGLCRNSVSSCGGSLGVLCLQTVTAVGETCDGRDNDCDGDTDEVGAAGTPKLVNDCFPTPESMFGRADAGICRTGQQACVAVANSGTATWTSCGMCGAVTPATTCSSPVTSQPLTPAGAETVCNGLDDDCDGQVDDGIAGVGQSCPVVGQQGRCAQGQRQCNGAGGLVCVQTYTSMGEVCNGLDDDCDGFVDEVGTTDLPKLKETCPGNNTGPCRSGERACNAAVGSGTASYTACGACGALATCTGVVGPQAEVCDTVDNDCDGNLNNGNPGGGGSCTVTTAQGVCRNGTNVCQSNGTQLCTSTVMPGQLAEVCDGLDNDCDGATDEVGGVGSATLSRVCFAGVNGTFTGTCGANPAANCTPRGECRGVLQICPGAAGFPTCNAAATGADGGTQQFAMTEVCDSRDNDCNGTNDNNPTGTGIACVPDSGVGACALAGTTACTAGALVCRPNTGTGEICDNIDNDCDGDIDEVGAVGSLKLSRTCYTGPAGSFTGNCTSMPPGTNCSPTGACRGAFIFCQGGMFPACTGATTSPDGGVQVFPTAEVCDNADNNCNGQNNEGLSGNACTTGEMGVCAAGTEQCRTNGVIECVRNQDAGPEVCDNLDNDCNGVPDNNVPPRSCFDGPSGTFTGTCGLSDGGTQTSGGGICSTRGLCRASTQQCNGAGRWLTCGMGAAMQQVLPVPEVCNGLDDNCNNNPDDGLFVDVDNDGVRACGTCGANPDGGCDCADMNDQVRPGLIEACNGLDDNCNGRLDEASTGTGRITQSCYSGPPNTAGRGVCVQGTQECLGQLDGGYGACIGERVPTAETCNMQDDDCNGTTDDGFDVDGDGFRACVACGLTMNCDCNDNERLIRPGAIELCDNVDNDCNMMVDDNIMPRACFSDMAGMNPPPSTYTGMCPGPTCAPLGVCRAGAQSCSAGMWGVCVNPTLPRAEQCDGRDDDCNGTVDNGSFDVDMDGVVSCALCAARPMDAGACDCNDMEGAIKPGAPEVCDNIDNDCDGIVDGTNTACYSGPAATRGKGVCRDGAQTCTMGMGTGACVGEVLPTLLADGGMPSFMPDGGFNDAEALCDGRDEDCDGVVDDGFDNDGDGVTTCQNDCDDTDPFNAPGGREICDCRDNNCNSIVDDSNVCRGAPCFDFDLDGFTNCQGDCNDDPLRGGRTVGPTRSEVVGDGFDNDCDGQVDENTDEDGDGFATGGPAAMRDCNDRIADVNPGAVERCDGFDNNCDGRIDEGFDVDGDFVATCGGDCDDSNPAINPTAVEICGNMTDDNCDGRRDEDVDADGDGVSTCAGDCNDFNPTVHPAAGSIPAAAEVCDGQDNDCDLGFDEGFDQDADRSAVCFGDCNDAVAEIGPFSFEVPNNGIDDDCDGETDEGQVDRDGDGFPPVCGDCNDFDSRIHPRAMEACNRVDDNCDSYVDSLPGRPNLCSVCFDADGDGQTNCDGDCNDSDRSVFRGAPEVCDDKDNDCDLQTDIDPVTGRRVCMSMLPDGGAGEVDGGLVDGGKGDLDGGATELDGGIDRPMVEEDKQVVVTGCGCGSIDGGFVLAALALVMASRRRRRVSAAGRSAAVLGLVLVVSSCASSISTPVRANDGGVVDEVDGGAVGDGGSSAVDAGVDAGLELPFEWPCPGLSPIAQVARLVPFTTSPWALPANYAVVENVMGRALVFDGPDVAGFVLQRDVPSGIDPFNPASLELVANGEVSGLVQLAGSPLVRDRFERSSRIIEDSQRVNAVLRTLTTSQQVTFGTPTTAFDVRNRLVGALSGVDPRMLGALPRGTAATDDDEHVVNLFFRIVGTRLFAGVVVSPLVKFRENQIALTDFANGSHLGDENGELVPECVSPTTTALKTDFLFVIDNTISMVEEQKALQDAAEGLFQAFGTAGLDFRLGVITTDSDILRGGGFTNDLETFKAAAKVGLGGNTTEMGIQYAASAIRRSRAATAANLRLRDDGAGLVVIFLSDEDNKYAQPTVDAGVSVDAGSPDAGARQGQPVITEFRDLQAVAFAIVGPKPIGCIRVGRGEASPGTQYIDLANGTGGSSGSICNPNLSEVIEEVVIGALGASSRTTFNKRPVSGSLAVRTTRPVARNRTDGFDYEPVRNALLFFGPSAPPVGTTYEVAFQFFSYVN